MYSILDSNFWNIKAKNFTIISQNNQHAFVVIKSLRKILTLDWLIFLELKTSSKISFKKVVA